jgi:hypothetical protein
MGTHWVWVWVGLGYVISVPTHFYPLLPLPIHYPSRKYKMSSESFSEKEATQVVETTQAQQVIILSDEEVKIGVNHLSIVMKKVEKGKSMGKIVKHFLCKYCPKDFQGPSTGTILKHLRKVHSKRCPELLPTKGQISSRSFFDKAKLNEPFNPATLDKKDKFYQELSTAPKHTSLPNNSSFSQESAKSGHSSVSLKSTPGTKKLSESTDDQDSPGNSNS